ncbi:MAG: alpha/beta hydrolase [Actinobacteria bacterium]|nr:alpha/beta hydrolase [Actinomycetota bacterium]
MTLASVSVGDGPPVLLVPGYTGSKEDFRLLLQPLADAGYRAVAYDQRGQYESPGPDDPASYTVEALAGDLLELADELGPVHLVGHSFGGLVSRAAVIREPAAFRSLTLLDSGPAALTGPRVDALPFLRPLLEQGGLVAVADALDAVAPVGDSPELRAFLRTRFLRNSPIGLVAMADALTTEPDRVDELATAGVPVQVVYGAADDAWSPATQAEMAARLGARVVVIPDALHSPAVENAAATVEALLSFF